MRTTVALYIVIAALGGFIAGFLVANSMNRTEIAALKAQNDSPSPGGTSIQPAGAPGSLTPAEIKGKIAEADKNPDNAVFQKDLGMALYRYAAMSQDRALLSESARILERANKLDSKDYDVLVALGNARFDIAASSNGSVSFAAAQGDYEKALSIKPDDADVRTDFALCYFLSTPANIAMAISEFQKALKSKPGQERALEYLTQAYLQGGQLPDAESTLASLRSANPQNKSIADLERKIAEKKSSTR